MKKKGTETKIGIIIAKKLLLLVLHKAPIQSKVIFIWVGSEVIWFICCFCSEDWMDQNQFISSECTGCYRYYCKRWLFWSGLLILPNITGECQRGYGDCGVYEVCSGWRTYCLDVLLAGSAPCGQFWRKTLPCGFLELYQECGAR